MAGKEGFMNYDCEISETYQQCFLEHPKWIQFFETHNISHFFPSSDVASHLNAAMIYHLLQFSELEQLIQVISRRQKYIASRFYVASLLIKEGFEFPYLDLFDGDPKYQLYRAWHYFFSCLHRHLAPEHSEGERSINDERVVILNEVQRSEGSISYNKRCLDSSPSARNDGILSGVIPEQAEGLNPGSISSAVYGSRVQAFGLPRDDDGVDSSFHIYQHFSVVGTRNDWHGFIDEVFQFEPYQINIALTLLLHCIKRSSSYVIPSVVEGSRKHNKGWSGALSDARDDEGNNFKHCIKNIGAILYETNDEFVIARELCKHFHMTFEGMHSFDILLDHFNIWSGERRVYFDKPQGLSARFLEPTLEQCDLFI